MSSRVISIPTNGGNAFILNVICQNEDPLKLDLDLEGTDGNDPFVGKLHESRLHKLLQTDGVSLEQWESILRFTLLQQPDQREAAGNVETIATLEDKQAVIRFRKNISGIYQSIGQIKLKKDINHAIDSIGWICTALDRSRSLDEEVQRLSKEQADHESALSKLKTQVEELQKAKDADIQALLEKFCEVLNSKKAKIRDQQRLLATATVDKTKAAQIRAIRNNTERHIPSPSDRHKRKSSHMLAQSSDDDDDEPRTRLRGTADAAADLEDLDEASEKETPEEATASDDEDSDDLDAPTQSLAKNPVAAKAKNSTHRTKSNDIDGTERNSVLPHRNLSRGGPETEAPIKNQLTSKGAALGQDPIRDEDEDMTTDDEL